MLPGLVMTVVADPGYYERLYNSGYKVITETIVVFKNNFFSWLHFSLWYDKWDCLIFLPVWKIIVFVPVVIVLGVLSAAEIADCKVKLTLLLVRMGLGAITLEVCREDVEGRALCGGCNGLRESNRQQRDLFCPIFCSHLRESSGESSRT